MKPSQISKKKQTTRFDQLFIATCALRLILREDLFSLLLRHRREEFLNIAGNFLQWPHTLLGHLRSAIQPRHDVTHLDDDCEDFTLQVSRTRADSRDGWFGVFQRGEQRLDVIGHLE